MTHDPEVPESLDGTQAETSAADERAGRVANAAHDIGGFIRAQREAAQVSLRQLAQLAGVSNPYLSQIERGLRNPSAEVLAQIAKGLRVSSEVLYMRAGYLEQRPHGPVRDALLADTEISERQKQVLLEIYESFRRENAANEDRGDATNHMGGAPGGIEGAIALRDNEVPNVTAEVPPRQENETS
ncbi:helix-turn-helix domain-containing protein [Nocardia sp. SYP-A9097]|uniref:helix-turn-helix domain-containing protein n=1 Tax=Nocardia sp. SYP-A9097 TaxID=2663237 RepID=UPI00129BA337|nr:helix-turn-helix transcriptional regulator [Nocardia sp. SYP-A9097]MRH87174.1 helix-turn-helix domain-containing protein [Nocardia sp. SYP-A9097]